MSIPTNEQIREIVDRLDTNIADDLESEFLDFKPWRDPKSDLRVAVEYAVCFANAAGGVIVFGVADRARGRTAAIHGASGYDIDVWRRGVFDATRPNLDIEVEELRVPEGTGTLLIVRIPKGSDPPYGTAQGTYKRRVGKNCMPLDPHGFLSARVRSGVVDWSGEPAEGVTLLDLDPVEIARGRNVLSGIDPESGLLRLDDAAFLVGIGALRSGRVTHTGLLLFGRESVLRERCPQHEVHYVYQTSGTEVARNDSLRCGLLQVLERIENVFSGPINPEQEVDVGLFKLRIPSFPVSVVREAVLNALTHRDYSDPGEILIRHGARELVIVSPGNFLADITPKNILRHEPISRNRTLAEAFQKLRLVERAGIGRRRIFETMLTYGKRAPSYTTDNGRVILRLFNGEIDHEMARLVARWKQKGQSVDLDTLLIVSYLRTNPSIDLKTASELLQLPKDEALDILERSSRPHGILEELTQRPGRHYRLLPTTL